ncbi:MAG: PH domain-containing protein [Bacteroidota bacterium]|nr:PH domain-containing protein [Bacteroidota bacterium]
MKKYNSNIHLFMYSIVVGPVFLIIVLAKMMPASQNVLAISLPILFILNGILMLMGTFYKIENNQLVIYSYYFKFRSIPIASITNIYTPEKFWSVQRRISLDLKGIVIKSTDFEDLAISPKEEKEFIEEIVKLNPKIAQHV